MTEEEKRQEEQRREDERRQDEERRRREQQAAEERARQEEQRRRAQSQSQPQDGRSEEISEGTARTLSRESGYTESQAVAGLEAAKSRLDAITMPPKPSMFASRKVKDEYEQEYREKRTQQSAAGAECRKQFDKLVSFGVSRYAYDPATQYSTEIDPAHISAGELKQLKDHAAVKLKELEQSAAQERQGAKPADAPTTTPERHRAAVERFRAALREIPTEYRQEARKALTDALAGYESQNGRGADLRSRQEIAEVMRRELPAQEQEQTRARTVKRSKTSHEDR